MPISSEWLTAWRQHYDGTDEELEGLSDRPYFTRDEAMGVVGWKLRRMWKKKHLGEFERNTPEEVEEITRRAFSCGDDLAAVMTLSALTGVSVPTASALLVAHDPERFTVADRRAWASLTNNGYLGGLEHTPWARCWTAYLEVCRNLTTHELTLRDVDRALWAAEGAVGPPK